AHINVECTAGFRAVKYIYKARYVYKGPDRASLTVHPHENADSNQDAHPHIRDETTLYVDARYISSSEGYARIMDTKSSLLQEFPSMMQLPVHLEREHY
ncbi:hypothetical protein EDB84DRAFT_1236684, partial [Lactarius hengduanensis]